MKSQAALEFMTIVALGLILIGAASFFGVDYIYTHLRDTNIHTTKQNINNIISGINIVYAQGIGAKTEVFVNIPEGVDRSNTYVYGNMINYRLNGQRAIDVNQNSKINVFGAIPTQQGRYTIFIVLDEEEDMGIEGALLFVKDADISSMLVLTMNDSYSSGKFQNEFEVNDDVYLLISLFKENFELIGREIELNVYYPNRTLYFNETINVLGEIPGFEKNIMNVQEEGMWLISAMDPNSKIIGTAYFIVSS